MEAVTAEAPEDTTPLCFSCGENYSDSAFSFCSQGCGTPLSADSDDLLCSGCFGPAFDRL
ncbi:hypothetical protein [Kitasatospora indigofera]|uniref:hypothetical protein n=1 Tax=Kitasatospora indigofera TaxID=67307 RepID=UPI00368A24DD